MERDSHVGSVNDEQHDGHDGQRNDVGNGISVATRCRSPHSRYCCARKISLRQMMARVYGRQAQHWSFADEATLQFCA